MDDREQAQVQALQAVVDRVLSWQQGATRETIRGELDAGVDAAGVEVAAGLLDELAGRIHADPERIELEQLVADHAGDVAPG